MARENQCVAIISHWVEPNKALTLHTVFNRISAAALIKALPIKCGAYLTIGRNREIFSFKLTVCFLSFRKFYKNHWRPQKPLPAFLNCFASGALTQLRSHSSFLQHRF